MIFIAAKYYWIQLIRGRYISKNFNDIVVGKTMLFITLFFRKKNHVQIQIIVVLRKDNLKFIIWL